LSMSLLGLSLAQTTLVPDVSLSYYNDPQGGALIAQIYHPNGAQMGGNYPLIIFLHGGSWISGAPSSPTEIINAAFPSLVDNGIIVASIQYTLSSQRDALGNYFSFWDQPLFQLSKAYDYLTSTSTIGVDVDQVACWGLSAGAQICGAYAFQSDELNQPLVLSVLYYPPSILDMPETLEVEPYASLTGSCVLPPADTLSAVAVYMGCLIPENDFFNQSYRDVLLGNQSTPAFQRLVDASLYNHADESDPFVYLAHGTVDRTVPIQHSRLLNSTLFPQRGFTNFQYVEVEGGDHGFCVSDPICVPWRNQLAATVEFLIDNLVADELPTLAPTTMTELPMTELPTELPTTIEPGSSVSSAFIVVPSTTLCATILLVLTVLCNW